MRRISPRLFVVAAYVVALLAGPAGAKTAHEQKAPEAPSVDDVQKLRAAAQSLVAPLPGIAVSPSLTLAGLTGVALVCSQAHPTSMRGVCETPLLRKIQERTSLPLFVGFAIFALVCYAANTGKIQGVLGKILKVTEMVPTLVMYFLLARTLFSEVGDPAPRVVAMGMSLGPSVLLALLAMTGLMAVMAVRLAIDLLVWLSPFPFVDLLLETGERIFAVGMLVLFLISPGAAAAVAVLMLLGSALSLGWALRMVRMMMVVVLRPLLGWIFSYPPRELVDDDLVPRFPRCSGADVLVEAVALSVPGMRRRTTGALVVNAAGVWFMARGWTGRVREVALGEDGSLEMLRCMGWFELRARRADRVVARVALPLDTAPLQAELRGALHADDAGATEAAAVLRRFFPDAPARIPSSAQAR